MHPILGHRQRLQLYIGAWLFAGALLAVLVRSGFGLGWREAFALALPLGFMLAPMSLSAWYLCRALPLARTPAVRVGAAATAAALTTAALWAAAGHWWWALLGRAGLATAPLPGAALVALLLIVGALAYLVALSIQYMLVAFEESAEAQRRVLRSELARREAELTALRAQVDPHFLFNSLNAISGLIGADPARARQMCASLAGFLRDCLALGGSERIPLGREIALAEQYLQVEQIRFGRRLVVHTSLGRDTADVTVPPLILQPLVENAVRHGIATCVDGGAIAITARQVGERMVVTIANPRDADGARPGTGLGVGLVRRRLAAVYGDRAALVLEPGASSYRATVTMPVDRGGRG